ncbi:hypothetical protein GCM10011507_12230 [Edaphobacter acidisoli]|uniref:Uncharacterized protein n=1 Tax=Edaphobacter acidisoli TaxID=2040573 RepID=A0A916RN03_9BACT|nr:hypothetical protein GCM10011507_12230 [Edaphobacter acidisoli]
MDSNDHGAIAPAVTVVNLHASKDGWDSENNVLIVPGAYTVNATWKSNSTVQIDCIQCPMGDADLITAKKGPVWILYGGISP